MLAKGNSRDAAAFCSPTDAEALTYSSSDAAIAAVDAATGKVTGIAPGKATITVADTHFSRQYNVTVYDIVMDSDAITIAEDDTANCIASVTPTDAGVVLQYTSGDESVVTVNAATGDIEAVTIGSTVITVTDGTVTKTVPVTVASIAHTPSAAEKRNEKAPTCTEDGGYDEIVTCTVCGKEISNKHVTLSASGHKWGDEWVTVSASTCSVQGEKKRECLNGCGATQMLKLPYAAHTDADDDGVCDVCGQGACDWCGKFHNPSVFIEWFISLLHRILPMFSKLKLVSGGCSACG